MLAESVTLNTADLELPKNLNVKKYFNCNALKNVLIKSGDKLLVEEIYPLIYIYICVYVYKDKIFLFQTNTCPYQTENTVR